MTRKRFRQLGNPYKDYAEVEATPEQQAKFDALVEEYLATTAKPSKAGLEAFLSLAMAEGRLPHQQP